MKHIFTKILFLVIFISSIVSCNVVKRVSEDEHLLTKTSVTVNEKTTSSEEINNLVYQRANNKLLGFPLRLHIYNLARPNLDSILNEKIYNNPKKLARKTKRLSRKQLEKDIETRKNLNSWLKKTGEPPVILDSIKTERSKNNLNNYYYWNGWFDREVTYEIDKKENKRAAVNYFVKTGKPYLLDSIYSSNSAKLIDSLYQNVQATSLLKKGDQFKKVNIDNERERLTASFRNSGLYHFSQDYIEFDIIKDDSIKRADVDVKIRNRTIRNEDSVAVVPFKPYRIRNVNIITDDSFEKEGEEPQLTARYGNARYYSFDKLRYRPKALQQAIFINRGDLYSDIDRTRTFRYLNKFGIFKYPSIRYDIHEQDSTLTANIKLSPRKKYGLGLDVNVSQSNIQSVGFSFNTGLLIRNIFRGAETFEISALGAIGASKNGSSSDQFFDINEVGVNTKLTIPRFFFPFNTERIIPKYMSPITRLSLGFTSQTNIGLDKQTVNGILNYNWNPSETVTNNLDLFNTQYVRNLNPGNYFKVYQNSFNRLENIAVNTYNTPPEFITNDNGTDELIRSKADEFIDLVLQDSGFENTNSDEYKTVNNIKERKDRLTEDNLIFATSFSYVKDNRENLIDETFSIFRFKLESAGNLLTTTSKLLGLNKNNDNRYKLFGVPYSQYIKTEFDYIKHWDIGRNNVIAIRSFFGIAIPYGNSNNIPFSKSFFAGGANDNRAWTAYNLGPGSSDSNNEFNEANMKIALSLEHRFNLFGNLNGALFIDAGNIWNVLDNEDDPNATFTDFNSLKDIAIGSGFGLRYDFGFFVFRSDIGFKTYDPSYKTANRWFNDYNFGNAVYNIGINYPF
ncbi:BamA/TamA family outer membrane protein [Flavobacteriaceae bacterium S0825]|uniref:translocation and assembly module lipoprotein TamL n=1 Tax=Gaetbulibacter sp. S0825 TaxID=2720084 RepID=UPI00142F8DC3|nr:BamA/TamA family outer membrane protein [Gaetbulibacter sp. S0825]MCK0110409.1 BamA/TamA family outer membrane protein [Flavobacteriaceae bacterium S0825]NIX66038.1 BamA/TamA family outer membrane protein [Gaetbulibacter sp. S0825]